MIRRVKMDKQFYTKELISEVLKECMVTEEEEGNDKEDNRDES